MHSIYQWSSKFHPTIFSSDINECETGFNDCHKWADCKNRDGTFECNCRPGYQGKKVPGVWANGRNCYGKYRHSYIYI